ARKVTIWRPFLIFVLREMLRLRNELLMFVTKVATITLATTFVFNFIMPQLRGQEGAVRAGYATVLAPGMVAVATCNQAFTAALTSVTYDFGPLRRIDQALMAPLPVPLIAVTRIIDGTIRGLLGASVALTIVLFVHAPGAAPQIDLDRWPILLCT